MAVKVMPGPAAGLVERPRLFDLLDRGAAGPATLVCGPAGSGKTMLVSSWLESRSPAGAVARVAVDRDETDAMRFWGAAMDALRGCGVLEPGDPLATLAPAPLGGQEEFVRRLSEGLGGLQVPVLLVFDDLEQLRSTEALSSLGRLLAEAPAMLRTVLVSRREPKLGLHRLRLTGALTEVRASDLELTVDEAGELIAAAGVAVSPRDVERLRERTEGWAAGLRLAALSLARHADPERFVAEFSGSERLVADYLVGEVLAGQPSEIHDLLLRTSILERVCGPLADRLTGRSDGARVLHELEEANALVMAVDVARSWFRYHRLLADLLRGELQREAPGEIAGLHRLAAEWLAARGDPIEAIRHAERAADWELAAELLGRHWVTLLLDGEEVTLASLLGGLPAHIIRTDAELAAIAAADRLAISSWTDADALLAAAEETMGAVPDARRSRAETALATVRLQRARQLGDLDVVVDGAAAALSEHADGDVGPELQALAHLNLGLAQSWTLRRIDGETHLTRGLTLGRQIGSPYLEVGCLNGLGVVANLSNRLNLAEELFRRAVAVTERVGWTQQTVAGVSYVALGQVLLERGRLSDGEQWLDRADPIVSVAPEPAVAVALRNAQGMLAFARGEFHAALAAFREGERLSDQMRAPFFLTTVERQWQLRAQLRLGETEPLRALLEEPREATADSCNLEAHLRLGDDDPAAAIAAVAPVLDGVAPAYHQNLEIEALLLDGKARLRLGDAAGARRSVERALDLAGPQGRVWIFLTVPDVRELLEAHPLHATAHAGHLKELLDHMCGIEPSLDSARASTPSEPLTDRELAVLRFLPTNLSAPDIAGELYLSVHTVKTHMRKLYAKLDVHTRAEAVQCGRALGLLAQARRS